jgi:hypothetical protein
MLERFKSMEGQTFSTLANNKKFDVLQVLQEHILIHLHSTDSERVLFKREIDAAWEALVQRGVLTQTDIFSQGTVNSAYIATLFSKLPNVSYKLHPVTLIYHPTPQA